MQRLLLVSLVLAGTVGCDQATKQLAVSELRGEAGHSLLGGIFRLGYAENPGAFLSLFADLPDGVRALLLTGGVGLMLAAMLLYTLATRGLPKLQVLAFTLFTGGGLGNWIDRVTNDGRVVDFMSLGVGGLRTGIFNVADLAIVAGFCILLFAVYRERPRLSESPPGV